MSWRSLLLARRRCDLGVLCPLGPPLGRVVGLAGSGTQLDQSVQRRPSEVADPDGYLAGRYRLPWEEQVVHTDGTSCGFPAPTRLHDAGNI